MDRSDERSALAWIMSGTVGAVVAAGLGKMLMDRRRDRALAEASSAAEPASEPDEADEAAGHPS
jgi:hypothetical protein